MKKVLVKAAMIGAAFLIVIQPSLTMGQDTGGFFRYILLTGGANGPQSGYIKVNPLSEDAVNILLVLHDLRCRGPAFTEAEFEFERHAFYTLVINGVQLFNFNTTCNYGLAIAGQFKTSVAIQPAGINFGVDFNSDPLFATINLRTDTPANPDTVVMSGEDFANPGRPF